jgi:hypothetical protein
MILFAASKIAAIHGLECVIRSLVFPFAKVRFIRSGFGSLETSDLSQKIAARCATYSSQGCCGCLPNLLTPKHEVRLKSATKMHSP